MLIVVPCISNEPDLTWRLEFTIDIYRIVNKVQGQNISPIKRVLNQLVPSHRSGQAYII